VDCEVIQHELVPYHFGAIDEEARARVEVHLLECKGCLRDFLALKRSVESPEERPSAAAKSRLRAAVAREIGHDAPARFTWSWWERPLAVAFAGVAMIAAIAFARGVQNVPGEAPHAIQNR
jgi:anti-sigma factor RsiW